jgi:hypothetical protein
MKKSLMRAVMVACLPLCAMGVAVVTTPAVAAEKVKTPSVSKSISTLISDAKKAGDKKDYQTIIAKCTEALAVPDLTDYDKYAIHRYLGIAYFNVNEHVKAKESLALVILNPATPPEDRKSLITAAVGLAAENNDSPLVIKLGQVAIEQNIASSEVLTTLAIAYYKVDDYPNTVATAQKGIDAAKAEGKLPQYNIYQVQAFSYDKLKDRATSLKVFELMARDYGNPDDWRNVIDLTLEQIALSPKGSMREIAALDLYRLRMTVNATWDAQNYLAMADAAGQLRSWGDAQQALKAGIAKGVLPQAKYGPALNQVNADAKKDEPSLPQLEKLLKNGKEVMNVAEAYYGYGSYADAARLAQKVMGMGGATATQARLLLAMSQAKMGDETAAAQTLANFSGDAALSKAAHLWNIYLQRTYGRTAAPAAKP